jgi:hypothetical protein
MAFYGLRKINNEEDVDRGQYLFLGSKKLIFTDFIDCNCFVVY